ncbi:MAG: hypothetical protein S4CHLAM102_03320 [Chlamydiia bacterium]|nr:hypothetical protein [Chlamydiia bacterium]
MSIEGANPSSRPATPFTEEMERPTTPTEENLKEEAAVGKTLPPTPPTIKVKRKKGDVVELCQPELPEEQMAAPKRTARSKLQMPTSPFSTHMLNNCTTEIMEAPDRLRGFLHRAHVLYSEEPNENLTHNCLQLEALRMGSPIGFANLVNMLPRMEEMTLIDSDQLTTSAVPTDFSFLSTAERLSKVTLANMQLSPEFLEGLAQLHLRSLTIIDSQFPLDGISTLAKGEGLSTRLEHLMIQGTPIKKSDTKEFARFQQLQSISCDFAPGAEDFLGRDGMVAVYQVKDLDKADI